MVDEALRQTRAVQSRIRDLPSRVVVYLLLAGCLFPELGYPGVWARLTAGLSGLPVAAPTAGALRRREAGRDDRPGPRRRAGPGQERPPSPGAGRYRDGSYLSRMGATRIRVIEARITIATSAGRRTAICRLATTLLDQRAYPAADLIRLCQQQPLTTRPWG